MFSHSKTVSLHRPCNQMSHMSHTTPRHELNHPLWSLPKVLTENLEICIPEGLLRYVSKSLVENGFFREHRFVVWAATWKGAKRAGHERIPTSNLPQRPHNTALEKSLCNPCSEIYLVNRVTKFWLDCAKYSCLIVLTYCNISTRYVPRIKDLPKDENKLHPGLGPTLHTLVRTVSR